MTFRNTASILTVAALTSGAAAQVPWGFDPITSMNMANGTNVPGCFFDWANGRNSNTNLFGTPTLVGGQFQFSPSNFTAQSNGTSAQTSSDQMNVRITAHAGQHIAGVMIQEHGSWSLTGAGSLQDTGTMFIQDLVNPRAPATGSMTFSVLSAGPPVPATMPIVTPGGGSWSGLVVINLDAILGPQWTDIQLIFTNTLQSSTTGAASTGAISKKSANDGIIVTPFFPAPGSGALLAAGCVVLARRRRR